jgi:hypothetical protein
MITTEIDIIYTATETYISSLEKSFLDKHLENPLSTPDDYDYDVKSYCILCHAALEDYMETIALKVLDKAIENYVNHHHLSESIVTLMHFKAPSVNNYFEKLEDNAPLTNVYDYTRNILKDIKARFSKEITMQNHGASLKYIRQLLMPVAIDIPNDPQLLNSLQLLANERGFFAHKFQQSGNLKRSIEPEKAKIIMEDCLLLCWDIRDKAKSRIFFELIPG